MLTKLRTSRPLRTFVQTFLAVEAPIVAGALANVHSLQDVSVAGGLIGAGVSAALAAAISAAMLTLVPPTPKA
jgi:hypothetical protein